MSEEGSLSGCVAMHLCADSVLLPGAITREKLVDGTSMVNTLKNSAEIPSRSPALEADQAQASPRPKGAKAPALLSLKIAACYLPHPDKVGC